MANDAILSHQTWSTLLDTATVATMSSVVSVSATQPIDVAAKVAQSMNTNLLQAMAQVAQRKGPRALFRGNSLEILRKVPTKTVRVVTNELTHRMLRVVRSLPMGLSLPPFVENFAVSIFAASFSVAVTYPFHLLHLFRSRGLPLPRLFDVAQVGLRRKMLPASYFRGVAPLCASTVPAVTAELFLYNTMRDHMPHTENDISTLMMLSLVARMVGQTFAQPFKNVSKCVATGGASGVSNAMRSIVAESGPLGLFSGMQVKYLKIAVSLITARATAAQMQARVRLESRFT